MFLKCISGLNVRGIDFREGERYCGHAINDNWWIVEAVGIKASIFNEHFAIEEITNKEDIES